jgi:lipopolysaccharide transport system permease protein
VRITSRAVEQSTVPRDENLPADATRTSDAPPVVIEPSRGWVALNLRELWQYRELVYFLAWRDIKVRYKQTVIGGLWAILQPVVMMIVFTLIFGRLAGVQTHGIPYPVFAYAALIPWTFFATSLNMAGLSLVTNAEMIRKIYFPRLTMPLAAVLGGGFDFILAFSVLVVMMLYYGVTPGLALLTIPLFVLLAFLTSLGISLWLAAINVRYRDVRYVIPFLTQIWLFATPVAYSSSEIPERWQLLYALNPMAGVVEGFRWALLGTETAPGGVILVSTGMMLLVFTGGLYYFRRLEREFADVV